MRKERGEKMCKGLMSGIGTAVAILIATFPLRAANIVINEPDDFYTSQTSLIDISGPAEGSFVGSIQDANLQVSFGNFVQKLTVGISWGVWNDPPATEQSLPSVLYTNGATGLTMTLSSQVNVFGFELEPDLGEIEPVTVTFFGTGSPFALTLNPNGNSGALLFAVSSETPINSVSVDDGVGDDFAIANVRYAQIPLIVPTPEPFMLLPIAAVLGILIVRQRRKKAFE
jgi:hypothetical protein